MKISKAIELGKLENWTQACARVNPSDTKKWYIMLIDQNEKRYMLADDKDVPVTSQDLDSFVPILKDIGLKTFSVVFS